MDDLIRDIQERTGLSADTVLEVVTMVTDYMRQALPEDLVEQISVYLGAAAESATGAAGSARNTAGSATSTAAASASGLIDMASGVTASAFAVAKDALDNIATDEDGS
jgi:hypothetical protein